MAALNPTSALRAARNAASIKLADTGAGASSIKLYTAPGDTLLAVRVLARPCGSVDAAGRIQLAQAATDDLVLADGGASYGEWCDADGAPIASGHVTDAAGNYTDADGAVVPHPDGVGPFVVSGTAGTRLYAGGVLRLATALIG
ncbi:MAG: hypothetical protein EPN34_03015 [Burkholderiaceae bacterium]|nr:MAG: hypothetical protein EPN34_03015 [Burkholderiaceae bacterium]